MVLQKEDSRSLFGFLKRVVAKEGKEDEEALDSSGACLEDTERAYEIADALEGGLARELISDLQRPLKRSISRLWKFKVVRSEDGMRYRLLSDACDFLMFASVSKKARQISFFTYDPEEKRDAQLFDRSRPAFVLEFDETETQWQLFEERCEHCRCAPQWRRCQGKRRVARVEHSRVAVGDGVFNCMDVQIPGLHSTGSQLIKCASCDDESSCPQRLATKQDELGRLSSASRSEVFSSVKNFQLATPQQPKHAVCQYNKIGPDSFGLDFRYPLSVAQAFSISMTTIFWT